MAKTYSSYKRSKILKSNLFWGITVGIILAIIVATTLPLLSISQINKQKEELEKQLREDLNDVRLLPTQLGEEETYLTTQDFIDQTSIENYGTVSESIEAKEQYLKLGDSSNVPIMYYLYAFLDKITTSDSIMSALTSYGKYLVYLEATPFY